MGTSDSYQNGNLKIMIYFAKFLGSDTNLYEIHKREQIITFLDTRIKDSENDPDKRWIRTWNDYLQRIKYFFRWLHNEKEREDKGLVLTGLHQVFARSRREEPSVLAHIQKLNCGNVTRSFL
ncbi:MAG: hypothetical protein WAK17_15295 [Candidatus Nitrosopolaris sp.]